MYLTDTWNTGTKYVFFCPRARTGCIVTRFAILWPANTLGIVTLASVHLESILIKSEHVWIVTSSFEAALYCVCMVCIWCVYGFIMSYHVLSWCLSAYWLFLVSSIMFLVWIGSPNYSFQIHPIYPFVCQIYHCYLLLVMPSHTIRSECWLSMLVSAFGN